MAGIYIHIPFCKQQCSYCDFHFSTTFGPYRLRMINSIARELEIRAIDWNNEKVETIYFGGGTPSLLTPDELQLIVETCRKNYDLSHKLEITLECNPDDCNPEFLSKWKQLGVNRLSIGLQALQNEQLDWMNRTHSSNQGLEAIRLAIETGFDNLTIDLMYGLPGLTNEEWRENIKAIANLPVQHISAYCLTVEERTPLAGWIKNGKITESTNLAQEEQFIILVETLKESGFEQYEISNFARDNHYSQHNTNYWLNVPYVGIGPSAHGFNGNERYWNKPNNHAYMNALDKGELLQELEVLSDHDKFNELLMIGLRTKWGVNKMELKKCLPLDQEWLQVKDEFIQSGELIETETHLILTLKGRLRADAIASDLFKLLK